jgi:hypothetical protein
VTYSVLAAAGKRPVAGHAQAPVRLQRVQHLVTRERRTLVRGDDDHVQTTQRHG